MLTDIQLLALTARTLAAQEVIAASRRRDLLETLASSPLLDPSVANTLAAHKALSVSQPALLRCTDPEILTRAAHSGVLRAKCAFRNPNMPEQHLTSDLHAEHDPALLARCINPTTPIEYRQQALSPETANRLVDFRQPLSYGVVRGFELALNNPWMVTSPDVWHQNLKRGLAGLYDVTDVQYAALTKGRTPWPAKKAHPAHSRLVLDHAPLADLVLLANPAVDLYLLGRRDLTESFARQMVAVRGEHPAEPHIIGRLVARFGVGILAGEPESGSGRMSSSRISAAAFTHPAVAYAEHIQGPQWYEAVEAAEMLEDHRDAWSIAISMSTTWHLGPIKLADTALRLSRAT